MQTQSFADSAADRAAFVAAMRRAACSVGVVATTGPAGRFAVTVSAIASVSADPPIVLVCINRRSPVCDAVRGNRVFTVNLLSSEQALVAETFAGRSTAFAPFDFSCAAWQEVGAPAAPLLAGALCGFHCHLHDSHDAGTHTILLGRVSSSTSRDAMPLIYTAQRYAAPQSMPTAMMEAPR